MENTTPQAAPAAPEAIASSEFNLESTESQETSAPESSEQEAEASIDNNPTLTKSQKVEAKKQLKRLKLKVDGREQEVEFDPTDDEFLTRELQKSRAFEKRAQDYSQLEKEVRNFIEELRKNPKQVLSDPNIGIDVKALAAAVIEEEIANSKKSPEQLAKEKLEAELKKIKEEREREKQEAQQKEFERIQEREYERYDTLMSTALEKSDLPKSPYVVKKMADYILMGLQNGVDVTPEDVLPLVREEIQDDIKQMFQVMPDEVIENIVGKDVFTRVRKKNIAKAKTAPSAPLKGIKDTGASSKANDSKADAAKKTSFRDFFGT